MCIGRTCSRLNSGRAGSGSVCPPTPAPCGAAGAVSDGPSVQCLPCSWLEGPLPDANLPRGDRRVWRARDAVARTAAARQGAAWGGRVSGLSPRARLRSGADSSGVIAHILMDTRPSTPWAPLRNHRNPDLLPPLSLAASPQALVGVHTAPGPGRGAHGPALWPVNWRRISVARPGLAGPVVLVGQPRPGLRRGGGTCPGPTC